MKPMISILAWTPPLAAPALMLAVCAAFGVDLDSALPWTIGGKTWRVGSVLDLMTLITAMWEMARAVQIDKSGLTASIVGMIVPRMVVGVILFSMPALFPDLNVVNLLVATIGAPGLAGLVRVSVARRDIALAR